MLNCNPETVSTDYDTSDKLFFEPVSFEHVMNIHENERPFGVVAQMGGQTPLNLAVPLMKAGVNVLGTPPDSIDIAEDRKRFKEMLHKLNLLQPDNGTAFTFEEAKEVAKKIGAPACSREPVAPRQPSLDLARHVPAEDWQRLASLRILFGHQSVGDNILQGFAEVARQVPAIRLKVIEASAAPGSGDACLFHFRAGKNGAPLTKIDDFVRIVDGASAAPPDIAFLKFCYIDTDADTDVRAVFDRYRRAVAA